MIHTCDDFKPKIHFVNIECQFSTDSLTESSLYSPRLWALLFQLICVVENDVEIIFYFFVRISQLNSSGTIECISHQPKCKQVFDPPYCTESPNLASRIGK